MRSAVIIVATVTVSACASDASPGSTSVLPGGVEANAVVERIVDGDTIVVTIDGNDERVRLTGIDTPEVAHEGSDSPTECLGDEATAFATSLIPHGTPVRLERDIVPRDDYGRLLAYVYRADDGLFVNLEIVRRGYAQPLTIPPNDTHADRFVQAARDAESDDVGLWSACE